MRRLFLAVMLFLPVVAQAGLPFGLGGSAGEFSTTPGASAALQTELDAITVGEWRLIPGTALQPTSYTSGWTVDGSAWKRSYSTRPRRVTLTTDYLTTCATPPTLTNLVAVADNDTNPGAGNYSYHPGTSEIYIGSNPAGLKAYIGGPGLVREEQCIIVEAGGAPFWGNGFNCITEAWSSGVYDPVDHRYLATGGGHLCYGGNEIYEFDFDTLVWTRLIEPEALTVWDGVAYIPANSPTVKHFYDGLTWFAGELWITQGTVGFWTDGVVPLPSDVWSFNPDTATWTGYTTYDDAPGSRASYGNYVWATVNPTTGNLFGCAAGLPTNYCYEVDPSGVLDTTPTHDSAWNYSSGNGTLEAGSSSMFLFKHTSITEIEFDGATTTRTVVESSLPTELAGLTIGDAAVDWIAARSEFIIWPNGNNVWGYEPATRTFRKYAPSVGSFPLNTYDYVYDQMANLEYVGDDVIAVHDKVTNGIWLYKIPDKGDAAEVFTP